MSKTHYVLLKSVVAAIFPFQSLRSPFSAIFPPMGPSVPSMPLLNSESIAAGIVAEPIGEGSRRAAMGGTTFGCGELAAGKRRDEGWRRKKKRRDSRRKGRAEAELELEKKK